MLSLFESGERLFKITSPVLTKIQGKNFHSIPVFNQRRSLPLLTSFHLCYKVIAFLVKMQIILIVFYFGYGEKRMKLFQRGESVNGMEEEPSEVTVKREGLAETE